MEKLILNLLEFKDVDVYEMCWRLVLLLSDLKYWIIFKFFCEILRVRLGIEY